MQAEAALATLARTLAAENARIDDALRDARAALDQTRAAVEVAQAERTRAIVRRIDFIPWAP